MKYYSQLLKNFSSKHISVAWVILIVALIIALWSWSLLKEVNYQRIKTTIFDYRVMDIKNAILDRMFIYQQMLRGSAGLFVSSDEVERSEWHHYVSSLRLDKFYLGIQGVGFAQHIFLEDKDSHLAKIRAKGGFFQNYTLKPDGEREEYVSTIYLEPMNERNQQAIGFDMFSESIRRDAIERARDTGEAVLSGKITLIQEIDEDIQAGCILYVPVYHKDTVPNTVAERRAALIGYVYVAFRMSDLMRGILGKQQAEIDFEIYDSDNIDDFNPNALMYDEVPDHEVSNYTSRFGTVEQLEIAGHIWTIRFASLPQFDIVTKTHSGDIILWSGIIISFLLFGMIHSLETARLLAIQQEHHSRLQQEVAERQRIELALRHSEKKYQRIVETAQEGIWIIDAQANTTYVNAKMAQMLGYSETEMLGKSLFDFMDNVAQQEALRYLERRSRGISEIHDFRFQCKDGSDLWAIVSTVVLLDDDGHFTGSFAMVTDITQRKLVEIALENQRNTLQVILDNIPVGIHVHEAIGDLKITLANRYGESILGKPTSHDAPLGQLSKIYGTFRYGTDEFYPVEQMPLTRALLGEIAMTDDLEVRRTDGTSILLEAVAAPIRDHTGKITAGIVIFSDITKRKKMELALRQAKEQAEIANRAKSVFLANMSHELRTPLNGILGYAQILNQDRSLTEDQREGIHVIARSGEHLLALINDILDLAKIEAGKVELSFAMVELEEFLQEIIRLFTLRAEKKNLAFYCELLTPLPVAIYADEKKLRQVVINLLGNAFKFTQQGHVTLKVAYEEEMLHFQVEDTGCGIAPADLDKIFDPFEQVGSEEHKIQGTGLGLSITKGLIEMMNGTLQVTSVLGQGTTFTMSFKLPEVPAALSQPAHLSSLPKIIGYQGERRTVLIIDDNWTNRLILSKMLIYIGFTVLEAENGQVGLNKVRQSLPFDVILVDLIMPRLDGFAVIEQLKTLPHCQKTVLIAISASAFEEDRQHSLELGCHAFIAKPIKFDLLLECLHVHLNLTWLYEQEVIMPTHSLAPEFATVELTSSQIEELLELTRRGDIIEICNFAEHLEQSDEKLAAFARYLRELATQFKVDRILKVIQRLSNS